MNDRAEEFRQLVADLEALASEARQRARIEHVSDVQNSFYHRGAADAYAHAAKAVHTLVYGEAPPPPVEAQTYVSLSEEDVAALLNGVGLFNRSLRCHKDGAFTAIFSRLQPVSQQRRLELLSAADPRLTILDHGTLPDSGEPFIDFAFLSDE